MFVLKYAGDHALSVDVGWDPPLIRNVILYAIYKVSSHAGNYKSWRTFYRGILRVIPRGPEIKVLSLLASRRYEMGEWWMSPPYSRFVNNVYSDVAISAIKWVGNEVRVLRILPTHNDADE